jgi:hypothetical protein
MNKKLYNPNEDQDYLKFLEQVRNHTYKAMKQKKVTIAGIAAISGRRPATVSRFLEGITISPHLPTVYRILEAVDIHLYIEERIAATRKTKKSTNYEVRPSV